jgi:hypothetical protein
VQTLSFAASAALDPDAGDRISCELIASINSTGYDAKS